MFKIIIIIFIFIYIVRKILIFLGVINLDHIKYIKKLIKIFSLLHFFILKFFSIIIFFYKKVNFNNLNLDLSYFCIYLLFIKHINFSDYLISFHFKSCFFLYYFRKLKFLNLFFIYIFTLKKYLFNYRYCFYRLFKNFSSSVRIEHFCLYFFFSNIFSYLISVYGYLSNSSNYIYLFSLFIYFLDFFNVILKIFLEEVYDNIYISELVVSDYLINGYYDLNYNKLTIIFFLFFVIFKFIYLFFEEWMDFFIYKFCSLIYLKLLYLWRFLYFDVNTLYRVELLLFSYTHSLFCEFVSVYIIVGFIDLYPFFTFFYNNIFIFVIHLYFFTMYFFILYRVNLGIKRSEDTLRNFFS